MIAIVGLGNVGNKYTRTRHNAGFMFIDVLSEKSKSKNLVLVKPDSMMNSSGLAVKKLVDSSGVPLSNLYIAHDDLDIKLGEYKIQKGRGPKAHNGVGSVEKHLGTEAFWRVRIGVENRNPENRLPGDVYVLQDFTGDEMTIINEVLNKASRELLKKLNGSK